MTAVPFMQLYVADYLGDTQHLTTEQHGAYLLLLMAMWRAGGSLPDDATQLARIARMTPTRWRKIAANVLAFFERADGRIEQKRLRKEIEKASNISRKRATAGARGGAANALKYNGFGDAGQGRVAAAGQANASPLPVHGQIQDNDLTTTRADALPADDTLLEQLSAAVGDALRLEALASLAEPRAWLAAGCDLHSDILPIIAMRCRDRLPDSIHAWSYFTAAIFEARERRRVHPSGTAIHARKSRRQSPHDALAAGMARALGAGGDGADRRDAGAAADAGADGGSAALAARGSGAAPGSGRTGGK